MITINICTDFSDTPGGRYIKEGKHSGEEFRDTILIKKIEEAEQNKDILRINFDGTYGFGTSFLEEAFGGIVRKYKKTGILNIIEIESTEDETIPDNVIKYVKDAESIVFPPLMLLLLKYIDWLEDRFPDL